jgi:hypothetical protein
LGAADNEEDWEGRKEKTLFLLEKSLRNLQENKERKRVSDTKGFRQQNHLDFSKLYGHVEEKCYPHSDQDITCSNNN